MRVFLVGPSGAGKTTVAPLLAAALGLPAHDTDRELERALDRPIAAQFARDGESAFRHRERELVLRLAAGGGAVIAVGAGAPVDAAIAATLRVAGRVVLLDATPATLAVRLATTVDRPLLAGAADLPARLAAQRAARDPRYRAIAQLIVETDALAPAAVSAAIRSWLAPDPR